MEDRVDITYLRRRIQELEEKIEQLRLSRRVLMNLIEKIEKTSWFLRRLEKENRKLQLNTLRPWLLRKTVRLLNWNSCRRYPT